VLSDEPVEPAPPEETRPEEIAITWREVGIASAELSGGTSPNTRIEVDDWFAAAELSHVERPTPDIGPASVPPSDASSAGAEPHVETPSRTSPNEHVDLGRPITVHVEPAPAFVENVPVVVAPEEETRAEEPEAAAEPESAVGIALEEPPPSSTEPQREQAPSPWERYAYSDHEVPRNSRPSGPLRVEVVIDAELEEPPAEIVIPDAVHEDNTAAAHPTVEIVAHPLRSWGDVLIALWLVLVASAVLATLLWRR
jgi:hypothetical protein